MYTTNSYGHDYTTRQNHLLHVNKSNINIYTKRFVQTSARIWNAMPSEIEVNVSSNVYLFIYHYHFILLMFLLPFKYTKYAYITNDNIARNDLYDYVSIMHIICMHIITIIHVEYGDVFQWYIS